MDTICRDQSGQSFSLDKHDDFLARGEDPGGKGDYQGCSEFNPKLIFSQEEEFKFKQYGYHQERNAENAANRRVIALMFRRGAKVKPDHWPCPRAKEGATACKKRFWSNGEHRRTHHLPDERREFENTQDTFACRFYHRLTNKSPCEQIHTVLQIRLYNFEGKFIPYAPYRVTLEGAESNSGNANKEGFVRIVARPEIKRCLIEWGYQLDTPNQTTELIFQSKLFLGVQGQSPDQEKEAEMKLNNLGYSQEHDQSENIEAFQLDYGHLAEPPLRATGLLDEDTLDLLRSVHKQCANDLRKK